jgi:hypothetical protein
MEKWSPQVKAAIIGAIAVVILAILSGIGWLLINYYQNPGESFADFYYKRLISNVVRYSYFYVNTISGSIGLITGFCLCRKTIRPTSILSGNPVPSNTIPVAIPESDNDHRRPLLTIDDPKPGQEIKKGNYPVSGRYTAKPIKGEKFAVFTRRGNRYWPKGQLLIDHDGTWHCRIKEDHPGETTIIICQVDNGIYLWVDLYLYLGNKYNDWRGEEIQQLPNSIRVDQSVRIDTVATIPGHAALALCSVLIVSARPWACRSRSKSSASRASIAWRVRTRYTVFCIFR